MRRHMHSWKRMRSWMHRTKRRRKHRRNGVWSRRNDWNDWNRLRIVWIRRNGKRAH